MQDIWKGNWNQIKGKIKQQWGKLTDDEIAVGEGSMDELIGEIQAKYGGSKEDIRRQIESFGRSGPGF